MKMWSGRFRQPLDAEFERWQRSFPFDRQLLRQELAASRAHAQALRAADVLSAAELAAILGGLESIARRAVAEPGFLEDAEAEDVHHFVERELTTAIGETGLKLHTGRSRNEQIATDLRLYVRDAIDGLHRQLVSILGALLAQAERAGQAAMPSYTHTQRAEPVLVAHWLLAYFEMLARDVGRLADCRRRLNLCPLGSGPVAGATLALDRTAMAHALDFDAPTANSVDATADRDFAIEFLQALSLLAVHLSRFAEEIILFSTQEYGFVLLPDAYATGSSAMPQKKNADALELIRGKSGRVIGAATAMLVMTKGLPLAYNKDMQETQEPVFGAAVTMKGILTIVAGFVPVLEFDGERMRAAASRGFMNAMAAATYLVGRGVPFRRAHEQIGHAVQHCLERGCELEDLSLAELREFSPAFGEDVYQCLKLEAVLACHDVPGGTAPARVREALAAARQRLAALERGSHAPAHA
jgi:argininosuccinate lyase